MQSYILSGILYCGYCGSKMIGVCEGKKGNWTGYRCKNKAQKGITVCNMRNVTAHRIENAVFKDVKKLFLVPEYVSISFHRIKEMLYISESKILNELNEVEAELKGIDESINRFLVAFEKGLLLDEYCAKRNKVLVKSKEKYEKQRKKSKRQLEEIRDDSVYFYQFKKYLYNIKLSVDTKFFDDMMIKEIIVNTMIQGDLIKRITILNPRIAKIKYIIGDKKIENVINFKSRVTSSTVDTAIKFDYNRHAVFN